jgi:uncharacterized membrane protein
MNLSQTGESRVRGYLFVLERSLRTFLPPAVVADASREVESHIRERVLQADGSPNERDALERILVELGAPLHVAQAYAAEVTMEEAAATGRLAPVLRAVWHLATTSLGGFVGALALFIGYSLGLATLVVVALRPIFPSNAGLWVRGGVPIAFGLVFPAPAGATVVSGPWVYLLAFVAGLALVVLTHLAARRWIAWLRRARADRPWMAGT